MDTGCRSWRAWELKNWPLPPPHPSPSHTTYAFRCCRSWRAWELWSWRPPAAEVDTPSGGSWSRRVSAQTGSEDASVWAEDGNEKMFFLFFSSIYFFSFSVSQLSKIPWCVTRCAKSFRQTLETHLLLLNKLKVPGGKILKLFYQFAIIRYNLLHST